MLCYARNHVNQVTGISKCQESPNCGQNDKKTRFSLEPAVDRQAREAKPSQARRRKCREVAVRSFNNLGFFPSPIWFCLDHVLVGFPAHSVVLLDRMPIDACDPML